MKPTFLTEKPLLTVMIQKRTPAEIIDTVRLAIPEGAEAFAVQIDQLLPAYQTEENYRAIFAAMEGHPCYITYYRGNQNSNKSDEEIADGLRLLAKSGATLCDVMGDMFCRHSDELTTDSAAVAKQMALIDELHALGAEVLMSSHLYKYATGDRIMEIAEAQKARGADIVKIVTDARNAAEEIEHLATLDRLKRELDRPFLFLSGGHCRIIRRIGILMGCCMCLCVYEHDSLSTPTQPLLAKVKAIRDNFN